MINFERIVCLKSQLDFTSFHVHVTYLRKLQLLSMITMGRCFLIAALLYGIICSILYRQLLLQDMERPLPDGDLLLLTAHPDDETMFFGPLLIRRLQQRRSIESPQSSKWFDIYILCVTAGEGDGDGRQRYAELINASRALGIAEDYVHILNDSRWKDGVKWPLTSLEEPVLNFIQQKSTIREVITFDAYGVSGHINHRSLYEMISRLKSRLPNIRFLVLKSLNLVQKYCAFFDVWSVYWMSKTKEWKVHTIGLTEYLKLISALNEHHSQMVWFRQLYSIFSKYMFFNIMVPL